MISPLPAANRLVTLPRLMVNKVAILLGLLISAACAPRLLAADADRPHDFGFCWTHQPFLDNQPGREGQATPSGDSSIVVLSRDTVLATYQPIFPSLANDKLLAATKTDAEADMRVFPVTGVIFLEGDRLNWQAWTDAQLAQAVHQPAPAHHQTTAMDNELALEHLPLPLPERFTPMLGVDEQSMFSINGQDGLFAVTGLDLHFKSSDPLQPHFEIGCEIPISQTGYDQMRWGIITQMRLEF